MKIFLCAMHDRHCDDWFKLFGTKEEAKAWIIAELETEKRHRDWDYEITENEGWFYSYDDGPTGRVVELDAPEGRVKK